MKRHVILGAGPAGVIAAETLRKHAPDDAIVVIGDEPEPPYSRMAIPYLLVGRIDERGTYLRKHPAHYDNLRLDVRRQRAKRVDVPARAVVLDDNTAIHFDTLLVATGSRPVRPPIRGMDLAQVHPCWTLEDARAIQRLATPGARVLQMGAGFIGCIILEALAARGVQLTVVEMGDRMVPRMMGPTAGGMIKRWCEHKGVRVLTGTRVEAIESGTPLSVRLSNGLHESFDLVISATGVKPSIGFLENSGVQCLQGVLTDEHMQTNVPGIYAAGDCAEAYDLVSGKTIVSAIQPNAADQAYVAAVNMAGRPAVLKGVTQINVLDTLGLISASFGDWQGVPGGQHAELTDENAFRHLSLQFDGDRLVGCNSIGWTDHVGVMRGLVEGRVPLGDWKDRLLHDPTRLMEAYLARAQAQDRWSAAKVA
ncbi:NAD(P)/FAD-dependent oxidoreductase [Schlegelella sp. S2-27]|uniref:NAD(P)/FAD-dependent oxidoreductase n=1 Tax=Caldimonas mangrovi TaxID=2944811 RepID=A0ABT0YLE6_9BURK|nr:NAD(P)/FAD-dependent oxidoreductase [Caldimonas mangrovi]MCM5679556.1 NAD(P)/FAD-dependent oxidoreductase [Caldimonas mangrovi]